MKLQFSLATLLLLTTVVAVVIGSSISRLRTYDGGVPWFAWELEFIVEGAPFWLVVVFAAYSLGRRTITTLQVILFVAAQIAALGVFHFYWTYIR